MFNPNWPTATIDSKTEHQKYYLRDGTCVPGVTSILSILSKPSLIAWAYKCGVDGIDYRKVRDSAASVGSCAHFMAECFVNQRNPEFINYDQELIDKAKKSFDKFQRYWEDNGFTLVASESQLVSEAYKYGGTIDLVVKDKQGFYRLIDIKTSKGIYTDYITQTIAYEQLWEESNGSHIKSREIVRIGKEDPEDFEIMPIPNAYLDHHWERFLGCLRVHQADVRIKQLTNETKPIKKTKKT